MQVISTRSSWDPQRITADFITTLHLVVCAGVYNLNMLMPGKPFTQKLEHLNPKP